MYCNMTNREKYCFDDFTLENYCRLVGLVLSKGFNFISYTDKYVENRKDILWRHDVEFEPDIALKMAEIEQSQGAKATYFFQMHSPFYNLFDNHYTRIFHEIRSLGHWIGLHFDSYYWRIQDEAQLDEYIKLDKCYLERTLGVKIDTFSFHNTTPFTQSCHAYQYGGLVNVYSSFFKEHYIYCGDSLGYWRFDRLEDVLNDDNVQHLQVLTHDANWSEEVLSPRKRIEKTLLDHANRLYESQLKGMNSRGLLWPDDDVGF